MSPQSLFARVRKVLLLVRLVVWSCHALSFDPPSRQSFLLRQRLSVNAGPYFTTALPLSLDSGESKGLAIDPGKRREKASTKGMDRVVVVQTGFGCCHGRNPTKAAVRACRNAIDSNSVKVRTIIPGGYEAMKIHIQLGVPSMKEDQTEDGENVVDLESIRKEFPYGTLLPIEIQEGGLLASNGIWQPGMAEPNDDMTLAVVCVTIGYDD